MSDVVYGDPLYLRPLWLDDRRKPLQTGPLYALAWSRRFGGGLSPDVCQRIDEELRAHAPLASPGQTIDALTLVLIYADFQCVSRDDVLCAMNRNSRSDGVRRAFAAADATIAWWFDESVPAEAPTVLTEADIDAYTGRLCFRPHELGAALRELPHLRASRAVLGQGLIAVKDLAAAATARRDAVRVGSADPVLEEAWSETIQRRAALEAPNLAAGRRRHRERDLLYAVLDLGDLYRVADQAGTIRDRTRWGRVANIDTRFVDAQIKR